MSRGVPRCLHAGETHIGIEHGVVDIWVIPVMSAEPSLAVLTEMLSEEELIRGSRFRFEQHRTEFVAGRGLLRCLLSLYSRRDPQTFSVSNRDTGKPFVPGLGLEFNLSHSHGIVAYAFTAGATVGIDVERVRQWPDAEDLAIRFFSRDEQAALADEPANKLADAFFRCWTRKEALVKALGAGLSMPLDSFSVLPLDASPVAVTARNAVDTDWWVHDVSPAAGYVGAIAVRGQGWRFRRWHARMIDTIIENARAHSNALLNS